MPHANPELIVEVANGCQIRTPYRKSNYLHICVDGEIVFRITASEIEADGIPQGIARIASNNNLFPNPPSNDREVVIPLDDFINGKRMRLHRQGKYIKISDGALEISHWAPTNSTSSFTLIQTIMAPLIENLDSNIKDLTNR